VGVRGVNLSRSSVLFEGPFGRIFRALPPADYGDNDDESETALRALADVMTADPDPVRDGPDAEEGGIPAAYTYLGQFIDHDLTFDPASSLQRQNDPDALVDYRTPRFDLDCVYGRGPDDQPYLYDNGLKFNLGLRQLTGAASNPNATDLPRSRNGRAIIGDPRNDENVIISQLQGLFFRFHNALATPGRSFGEVQRQVRYHYQWIVLNDFLPTIVSKDVLADIVPHISKGTDVLSDPPVLDYYKVRNEAYMPLEFSAAAYRFGHSMVRPGYRLSETIGPLPIFAAQPNAGLTGFHAFPANWAIDWRRFVDLAPLEPGDEHNAADPGNKNRLQLAYRIDTSIVNPLGSLPSSIAVSPANLAARNLLRGWRMRLPSGQAIARAMGLPPMQDKDIKIGKFTGDAADIRFTIDQVAGGAFKGGCPLWAYILAETVEESVVVKTTKGNRSIKTRKLGPVGGRIVAETIVGIILADSSSFLAQDPLWTPWRHAPSGTPKEFHLRDLVSKAL